MRGHSDTMMGVEWNNSAVGVQDKKVSDLLRYEGSERRDTYRLNLSQCYPVKMVMIINDMIIKKGVIKDLSAGGFACDFLEPTILPLRQKTQIRFKLNMDDPVIIKSEAIYQGVKGSDARVNRFEFSDIMNEGERDSIHQFILIKQLEAFRNNRRRLEED